jgi:TolB-like protein/AraC-like DNA-binding protein
MIFSLAGKEEFIKRITELILENLEDENFGVKELVAKTGMNPSTIHRRVKAFTNKNISQYIREIRLHKSLEFLQQDELTISEVAYRTGFSSPAYFNKCFHEYYGYPPGEYKKLGLIKDEKKQDSITGELVAGRQEPSIVKSKRTWKSTIIMVSSGILAIIILFFLINNFFPGIFTIKQEKSIALLPFRPLSREPDNQYFAEGMEYEIVNKLCMIKGLRVISRTSVAQYKGTYKTMPQIGRELEVDYLLEASLQKIGDNLRLTAKLINVGKRKESQAWAKKYDCSWNEFFSVQSELAQVVAQEVGAVITPEEKKRIEKAPTADLTAYKLYLQANEFKQSYWDSHNLSAYDKAFSLYKAALDFDPGFAEAWVGLGTIYTAQYYLENKKNFMDSCLVAANKALAIDDQQWEAYYLKGDYYWIKGNSKEALDNYDKSLQINPNYYWTYERKGRILTGILGDFVKGIDNYNKALTLIRGDDRPDILRKLGRVYLDIGFPEKAKDYYQEAFDLDGNKSLNSGALAMIEFCLENYDKAVELAKKADKSNYIFIFNVAPGHNKEALSWAEKFRENDKKIGSLRVCADQVGSAYYQAGRQKEAEYYFKEQIRYAEEDIKLGEHLAQIKVPHFELAASYAMLGDKEKAYRYLDEVDKFASWWIIRAKHDPLFNSIRGEERFQKKLQNMEAKYRAEHERVRKWLEKQ